MARPLILAMGVLVGCAAQSSPDAGPDFDRDCAAICERFVAVCGRACQLGDCVTAHDAYAGCPPETRALFACASAASDEDLCHLGSTTCGPEVLAITECFTRDAGR